MEKESSKKKKGDKGEREMHVKRRKEIDKIEEKLRRRKKTYNKKRERHK